MLQDLINKQEYVFEAWNRNLLSNPNAFVLYDSLNNSLKRKEVDDISGSIYAYLKDKGIGKEDVVFIKLERSVKIVLAIMGVLKNGSAFTVVESNYAKDRIDFIYKDCKAKIIISEDNWDEIISYKPLKGYEKTNEHDAFFYVYTSGTTGTPKGVIHEYGQIKLEMISETEKINSYGENHNTKFAMFSPFNFVASMKVVLRFIYSGGKLHIIDNDTVKNPKRLISYLLLNRLNDTFFSPSHYKMFKGNFGPFIKRIHIGAEPASDIYKKGVKILNTYTMSESMFTVLSFTIDKPYKNVPMGKPMFDLPIKLVDENRNQVKENEIGEICFYNPYCRGYVNNDEENKKRFKDGWFYTGDSAAIENGLYMFKGRIDDMAKINGNRIEPNEIEVACKNVLGIKNCVAKGFEKEAKVVLYYTDEDFVYDNEKIKKLENVLPYYMIPSNFIKIDSLPITKLGKIDRKMLSLPKEQKRAEYVAPRNDFEIEFVKAVEKILSIDKIGINDDIFSLGLTSIGVMQVLETFDKHKCLSPTIIYNGRTINEISRLCDEKMKTYLTVEEKEEIGRKANYPISNVTKLFYEHVNNACFDLYTKIMFPFFMPKYLLVKRINKLIENDSTFNLVLRKLDDGLIHYAYNENTPYVKLEHMAEEELQNIDKTFLKPFELEKPLIRIRIIECKKKTYLYLHVAHIAMDGAGFHNFLNNLENALKGKEVEKVYYFAWVYDENKRVNGAKLYDKENLDYYEKNYFLEKYDNNCLKKDITSESGVKVSKIVSVPVNIIEDYCKNNNITVNTFIVVATNLAQLKYNRSKYNLVSWNYGNRDPSESKTGLMVRTVYFKLNLNEVKNLQEVYNEFKKQSEVQIKRIYNNDFHLKFKSCIGLYFNISYFSNWFVIRTKKSLLYRILPLTPPLTNNNGMNAVLTMHCENDNKNINFRLQYGLSNYKSESISKYMDIFKDIIDSMLDNSIDIENLI